MPSLLFAGDGIPANVDLAGSAVDDAAARIVERFHLQTDSSIVLDAKGESPVERFVIGKLTARLSEKHHLVTNTSEVLPILTVTVVRADVRYVHLERKRPWSHAWLTRRVEIELLCQVKNSVGEIHAETIASFREDRISLSELETVEQGGLVFGIPDRPKGGRLSRWLEPMLAAAVTGTVIYLFFHIRSK